MSFVMMLFQIIFALLLSVSEVESVTIDSVGCGVNKGCWFEPQGCEDDSDMKDCQYMFTWRAETDGLLIQLGANLTDVQPPFLSRFMSVGFSYDDKMGEDSVVECVAKPSGEISAYMSFNDRVHNFRQHQAASLMLSNFTGSMADGLLTCEVVRLFKPPDSLSNEDKFKNFDIGKGNWILMLAKGIASPFTDELIVHGLDDGDLYPWISRNAVYLRALPTVIKSSKHYDIKRSVSVALAQAHGVLFLFAWWIFGTASFFLARYFKDLWPKKKLFGSKIWYQLHRDVIVFSLVLQGIAFALVFIEAGKWFSCTNVCESDDYALKLHTILGLVTTIIALIQPFLAWFRPGPNDFKRPYFNWLHWFLGMASWLLATVTIFVSTPLGKTGLRRKYKYAADYLMAGYISAYILATVVLEILLVAIKSNTKKVGIVPPTEIPMAFVSGPIPSTSSKKSETSPLNGNVRTITMSIFMTIALGIVIALSVMICKH